MILEDIVESTKERVETICPFDGECLLPSKI